jgi:hypothetical protein
VVEKTTKLRTYRDKVIDGKTVRAWLWGDDIVRVEVFNEAGWRIGDYESWKAFEQAHTR